MAESEVPKSFRDPYYASLAADVEKRQGLPAGLLSSIITHGERSNADQVSEDGARTVAQIIPATRKAALAKYGIDAYLSPENALEVAGLLLKDSLKRNYGDPLAAAGEYHGGMDRKNWGPRTTAYVDRVAQGLQSTKTSMLGGDFAKWMAENPAEPAAATATATAAAASPLDASFASWIRGQRAGVADIPGDDGKPIIQPPATPERDPTLGERAIGTGEAALSTISGLTGGTVGMALGTGKGIVDSVLDGTYGTQEGVANAQKSAMAGAQALTYEPRTASGQSQAAAVGEVMQNALPIAPLGGEMATLAAASKAASPAIGTAARAGGAAVSDAAGKVRERVGSLLPGAEEPATPTPGTMGSVGAASTDAAVVRQQAAQELGLPPLTKGQAERSFEQTRFEGEMAKDPLKGQQLRERFADQNQALAHKLDAWVDDTGAKLTDLPGVGDAVTAALRERAAADKAGIRVAYKNAEKAGELAAPVNLDAVVNHLNENAADAGTAPLLNTVRAWVKKLGMATEENGELVPVAGSSTPLMNDRAPGTVTLGTAEKLRQIINRNTDYEATNVRQATILKGLIDQATEGAGGDLYRQARQLRRQYAERYENFGLANDLLNTKRGTSDARIAAEDVFRRSVLSAPMADVKQLARLLKTSGEPGRQAWAELQGAAVRFIRDEATKAVARDERGNPIVSAAGLNRSIEQLDRAGKLDYLFGKKGAEQMRAINDLAKVIKTVPPGAVNNSNTASVILAALDMATSGIAGMPLPVMSGLRILTTHVRDRKIQRRIQEALGVDKPQVRVKSPKSIVPPSPHTTQVPAPNTVH